MRTFCVLTFSTYFFMIRREICTVGVVQERVEGLQSIFAAGLDFEITRHFEDVAKILEQPSYDLWDLFIVELPADADGLDDYFRFLRVANLTAQCVVVTPHLDPRVIQRSIQYGASGLIHANRMGLLIYQCVEKVAAGDVFICAACLEILVNNLRMPATSNDLLSEREKRVLELLAKGLSYSEVSNSLNVSLGTTKSHVSNIYKKLKARNISEAMLRARQHKIIE